jgi:hypothetical protein
MCVKCVTRCTFNVTDAISMSQLCHVIYHWVLVITYMHTCLHVCTFARLRTQCHRYVCTYMHTHTYKSTNMCTYTLKHTQANTPTQNTLMNMHKHTHAHTYTRTHTNMQTYTYTCIHIQIYAFHHTSTCVWGHLYVCTE